MCVNIFFNIPCSVAILIYFYDNADLLNSNTSDICLTWSLLTVWFNSAVLMGLGGTKAAMASTLSCTLSRQSFTWTCCIVYPTPQRGWIFPREWSSLHLIKNMQDWTAKNHKNRKILKGTVPDQFIPVLRRRLRLSTRSTYIYVTTYFAKWLIPQIIFFCPMQIFGACGLKLNKKDKNWHLYEELEISASKTRIIGIIWSIGVRRRPNSGMLIRCKSGTFQNGL